MIIAQQVSSKKVSQQLFFSISNASKFLVSQMNNNINNSSFLMRKEIINLYFISMHQSLLSSYINIKSIISKITYKKRINQQSISKSMSPNIEINEEVELKNIENESNDSIMKTTTFKRKKLKMKKHKTTKRFKELKNKYKRKML